MDSRGVTSGDAPLVSVVIVTFNSAADLPALLAGIDRHSRLAHEVVIVDNSSTDGTPEILASLESFLPGLHCQSQVCHADRRPGHQRHTGSQLWYQAKD